MARITIGLVIDPLARGVAVECEEAPAALEACDILDVRLYAQPFGLKMTRLIDRPFPGAGAVFQDQDLSVRPSSGGLKSAIRRLGNEDVAGHMIGQLGRTLGLVHIEPRTQEDPFAVILRHEQTTGRIVARQIARKRLLGSVRRRGVQRTGEGAGGKDGRGRDFHRMKRQFADSGRSVTPNRHGDREDKHSSKCNRPGFLHE